MLCRRSVRVSQGSLVSCLEAEIDLAEVLADLWEWVGCAGSGPLRAVGQALAAGAPE